MSKRNNDQTTGKNFHFTIKPIQFSLSLYYVSRFQYLAHLIERKLGIRWVYLKLEGFGFRWGFLVGLPMG